jgi:hypothetical protein
LQAADLLAIESHVQDVCSALAARLFASGPRHRNESTQFCPTQVLLCSLVNFFMSLVVFICRNERSCSAAAAAAAAAVVLVVVLVLVSSCPISILNSKHRVR